MNLLGYYRAFAIDLDGVVWKGEHILEGAIDALLALIDSDKSFLLLTNNASYLPNEVGKRLAEAGAPVSPQSVLTSAMVAKDWIESKGLAGKASFVLGTAAVKSQFEDLLTLLPAERGQQAELVFVARDPSFTYDMLSVVADSVRAGASFIAANRDSVLPVAAGFEPGTGALLAAIEAASGRVATVMGKPEEPMMQAAVGILGTKDVLMIGDRLESDIRGAASVGWDSALIADPGIMESLEDPHPHYVGPSLGEVLALDESLRIERGAVQ